MKLFVGQINEKLISLATKHDSTAQPITEENKTQSFSTGYTSLSEFSSIQSFFELLLTADSIFYCPESFDYEDFDFYSPTSCYQGLIENLLMMAKQEGILLENFNYLGQEKVQQAKENFLNLTEFRKEHPGPQLWGAGCSMTYGVGVNEPQRYINLLGQQLDMPVNCLALPGTSISWAADQILRSNIQKDDIVVWGLTNEHRLPFVCENSLHHLGIHSIDTFAAKEHRPTIEGLLTNDDLMLYNQLIKIEQVTNFCDKIGAKLFLFGLLSSTASTLYLHDNPHFYHYWSYDNEYKDLAPDGKHPGPIQHSEFASIVLRELIKRNYI